MELARVAAANDDVQECQTALNDAIDRRNDLYGDYLTAFINKPQQ